MSFPDQTLLACHEVKTPIANGIPRFWIRSGPDYFKALERKLEASDLEHQEFLSVLAISGKDIPDYVSAFDADDWVLTNGEVVCEADPAEYIPSRCAYKHENDCWSVILRACSEQEIVAIKESGNTEQEWRVMFNEPTNAQSSSTTSESEAKSEIMQLKASVDQALLVLNEAKEIAIKTPGVYDSQVRIRDPEKQTIYTEASLRIDRVIEAKKQKAIAAIEVDDAIAKRRKTMELSDEQDSLFQMGNESYDTLLDFATARELLIESRLKSA